MLNNLKNSNKKNYSQIVQGTAGSAPQIIRVDFGRDIASVRTFDLTAAGGSAVHLLTGAIRETVMTFNISGVQPTDAFHVRFTAFSGSALVHASAMIMIIAMLFAHFLR